MKKNLLTILAAFLFGSALAQQADVFTGIDINLKDDITTIGGKLGFVDKWAGGYVFYKNSSYSQESVLFNIDSKSNSIGMGMVVMRSNLLFNAGVGWAATTSKVTTLMPIPFANVIETDKNNIPVFELGLGVLIDENFICPKYYTRTHNEKTKSGK